MHNRIPAVSWYSTAATISRSNSDTAPRQQSDRPADRPGVHRAEAGPGHGADVLWRAILWPDAGGPSTLAWPPGQANIARMHESRGGRPVISGAGPKHAPGRCHGFV